jgi:hypothetical protein
MENKKRKPNNPYAFPLTDSVSFCTDGMSLRDYFAAKAMQSYIRNGNGWGKDYKNVAIDSYKMADAMLKERENE